MTIANLKIGRQRYVVLPERDFDRLQRENKQYRRLLEEDQALGKLADKELKAFRRNGRKGVVWEQIKKEVGF